MYKQAKFYEDALNGALFVAAVVAAAVGSWGWFGILIALPAISLLASAGNRR
jgi:hypothetical protein